MRRGREETGFGVAGLGEGAEKREGEKNVLISPSWLARHLF